MNISTFVSILTSVSLSVIAQILLKHGMSSPSVQLAMKADLPRSVLVISTNLSVIAGFVSYASSAAVWLFVLSKIDVSRAYPFVGLGFIGTMLFAHLFLNEPITTGKIIGTVLVAAGIWCIS